MTTRSATTSRKHRSDESRVADAALRAKAAVETMEALRGRIHQHIKDMLPLYEEFQRAVELKRAAVRDYMQLTGDELSFGGYFDLRENPVSYQDLKADDELFKMVKALRFCRACKVT